MYNEEYLQKKEDKEENKGKFQDFLKTVEKLDQEKEKDSQSQDYNLDEVDVSFDRILN